MVRVPLFALPVSLASAEMVTPVSVSSTSKTGWSGAYGVFTAAVTVTSLLPPVAGIVTVVGSAEMVFAVG